MDLSQPCIRVGRNSARAVALNAHSTETLGVALAPILMMISPYGSGQSPPRQKNKVPTTKYFRQKMDVCEYDWVMGAQEPGLAAARVNRFHPGRAISRVYAGLSHGIHTYASAANAFRGQNGKYDPTVATDVSTWLRRIASIDSRAK